MVGEGTLNSLVAGDIRKDVANTMQVSLLSLVFSYLGESHCLSKGSALPES